MSDLSDIELSLSSIESSVKTIQDSVAGIEQAANRESVERAVESLDGTLGKIDEELFDIKLNVDSMAKYSVDNALNLKWIYEKVRDSASSETPGSPSSRTQSVWVTGRSFDWLLFGIFLLLMLHVIHHW